ncbi:MAG: hypothetical protein GY927_09415 [bacterium]|nr:hypothetical protein [bacterium]
MRKRPITFKQANDFIEAKHRHHGRCPAGFHNFCVGVEIEGELRGVAICGRPSNRNNHDGYTIEVLRVATDGTKNACSMLLGGCAQAAKSIGADRIITYTLESEGGASLKAAGWTETKRGIKSFWMTPTKGRSVAIAREHMEEKKVRYELNFG